MDLFDVLRSFSRAISTLLGRIFGRVTSAPIHRKRLLLLQTDRLRLAYQTEQKPTAPLTAIQADKSNSCEPASTQCPKTSK